MMEPSWEELAVYLANSPDEVSVPVNNV